MYYSAKQASQLEQDRERVLEELSDLWISLARNLGPSLKTERAREYMGHGVCRRLQTIRGCIDNIFNIFPIDRTNLLNQEERVGLEINLHAFLINVHGIPDNLAWIYVLENDFKISPKINPLQVGLFKKQTKKHLPTEVCKYLNSAVISNWHNEYAKNYRDALAHRIPPYVPPSTFTSENETMYKEINSSILEEYEKGNFDRALLLSQDLKSIGTICPAFTHSLVDAEACSPMEIHSQILVDAMTVMEIIKILGPHLEPAGGQ